MNLMKRKLKITVTKVHRRTAALSETIFSALCPICNTKVELMSSTQAAAILEIDNQKLEVMIIDNRIHRIETASGNLWVCKDSLFKRSLN